MRTFGIIFFSFGIVCGVLSIVATIADAVRHGLRKGVD